MQHIPPKKNETKQDQNQPVPIPIPQLCYRVPQTVSFQAGAALELNDLSWPWCGKELQSQRKWLWTSPSHWGWLLKSVPDIVHFIIKEQVLPQPTLGTIIIKSYNISCFSSWTWWVVYGWFAPESQTSVDPNRWLAERPLSPSTKAVDLVRSSELQVNWLPLLQLAGEWTWSKWLLMTFYNLLDISRLWYLMIFDCNA